MPTPKDEEYLFQGHKKIVSETDTRGIITFANRRFCEISGYALNELLDKPHNIIRHPDMPKVAFTDMWDTIKAGKEWHGFVKNLRKDGLYYWVETHISPTFDEQRNIVGYIAARGAPERKDIEQVSQQYKQMLEKE